MPMQLPSIRSIQVPWIIVHQMPIERMQVAAATTPVTHLRFSNPERFSLAHSHYTDISARALDYVLRVPIALTHFSYSSDSNSNLELPVFMRSISLLRLTLQYMHLDFSDVTLPIEAEENEVFLPSDAGSLREWLVLRTMSCSLMPLLGKQVLHNSVRLMNLLPPGLRELEILQDWKWEVCDAVEHVVEMLAQKPYAAPRLEKVAVVTSCRKSQRTIDKLTVACETAGVSFVEQSFCW
ncbi:hypothetical protein Q9L58_009372 [Maublancomyces gigas]|uniref:Uncharacterized protein n=1 Tax=Discina gigas TaxID=1032678 RepID=A0ABR3G743_9PEZI